MVDPQVKHLPELWKPSSRGKGSAQVSIVSLDLAPEDTLSSATRLVLVGKQEDGKSLQWGSPCLAPHMAVPHTFYQQYYPVMKGNPF